MIIGFVINDNDLGFDKLYNLTYLEMSILQAHNLMFPKELFPLTRDKDKNKNVY